MAYLNPYMSAGRYGGDNGSGYRSSPRSAVGSGSASMNRKPSYNTQISSEGYSSSAGGGGGSYSNYGAKKGVSSTGYTPGSSYMHPSSSAGGRYKSSTSTTRPSPSTSRPYSSQQDYASASRPSAATGSTYNTSGYTSDYGRSGYASGNGYKSGYGSDYGQSGYASGTGYGSDYGHSGYASGTGYGSDYNKTPAAAASYSSYDPSKTRSSNYATASTYRRPSATCEQDRAATRNKFTAPRDSFSRSSVNSRTGGSTYGSGGNYGSGYGARATARASATSARGSISRSVSREEPKNATTAVKQNRTQPVEPLPPPAPPAMQAPPAAVAVNKAEHRKSRECKAPADFTSESSSSSSEEEESEDSPNEETVFTNVVHRATSPTQKPPPPGDYSKSISATVLVKVPQRSTKVETKDNYTMTGQDDQQVPPARAEPTASRSRYSSSSKPTSSGYYDRSSTYYNRYSAPSGGSYKPTSTRSYSSRTTAPSPPKSTTAPETGSGSRKSASSNSLSAGSRQNSKEDNASTSPKTQQNGGQGHPLKTSVSTPHVHPVRSGSGHSVNAPTVDKTPASTTAQNDIENKEFRKSVLNMNHGPPSSDTSPEELPRSGLKQPEAPITNTGNGNHGKNSVIAKSNSRGRVGSSEEERRQRIVRSRSKSKLDQADVSTSSSSEAEEAQVNRTHSRSRMNHDANHDAAAVSNALSKSLSRIKVESTPRSRCNSNRGSSQEDLVDSRRRSPRGSDARSRHQSQEDLEASDDDDARSAKSTASGHRRRRKGSKDSVLDEDFNDGQPPTRKYRSHRRHGSLEGVLDDLPPRPSRHGSRESILDEKATSPRKRHPEAATSEDVHLARPGSRTSPQNLRRRSNSNSREDVRRSSSRSSRENMLDDKSVSPQPPTVNEVRLSPSRGRNNVSPIKHHHESASQHPPSLIPIRADSSSSSAAKKSSQPDSSSEESDDEDESEDQTGNAKNSSNLKKSSVPLIRAIPEGAIDAAHPWIVPVTSGTTLTRCSSALGGTASQPLYDRAGNNTCIFRPISCGNFTDNSGPRASKSPSKSPSKMVVGGSGGQSLTAANTQLAPPGDISANKSKKCKDKFIGNYKDIDSLLCGDQGISSFEDLEEQFCETPTPGMIIVTPPPPQHHLHQGGGATSGHQQSNLEKQEAKKTLGMFIGKCKDIDDVLGGMPPTSMAKVCGSLSPESKAPFQMQESVSATKMAAPVRPTVLDLRKNVDRAGVNRQEVAGQAVTSSEEEEESDGEEGEEGGTSSSAVEEIGCDAVKVHNSEAQQPRMETYTEEIDSSAVRIRQRTRAQAPDIQTYTEEIDLSGVRIREPRCASMKGNITKMAPASDFDDCTLQLYKHNKIQGDYSTYLDLESTIDEQQEEFDGFLDNRKNAIILRTQLPVRVHAIIEKLMHSEGRDLRRALFSLKQIFQDDKDLVHEFVQNDGLSCLIKVGSEADQNYQNYILRALGQVMLYVDGMNGVIDHNETIQWLYSLISSKYRLVVKTALKLLLVFVEYTESNCILLINAVNAVDSARRLKPWTNIMILLNDKDSIDVELLIFAMTLINKMLNGIPDQDTYYDVVDCLEEQGMERIIQRYMSKQGTDLDLLQQFQIYEAVLKKEDGDEDGPMIPLDPNFSRQVPRSRKSLDENERRKSRRHSLGNVIITPPTRQIVNQLPVTPEEPMRRWHRDQGNQIADMVKQNEIKMNGANLELSELNGVTPALRRRRERDARHRSFIKEQEGSPTSPTDTCEESWPPARGSTEMPFIEKQKSQIEDENRRNREISSIPNRFLENMNVKSPPTDNKVDNVQSRFVVPPAVTSPPTTASALRPRNNVNAKEANETGGNGLTNTTNKKSWMLSMMYSKSQDEEAMRRNGEVPMMPSSSSSSSAATTAPGVPLSVPEQPRNHNHVAPTHQQPDERLLTNGALSPRISQAEVFDLRREGTVKDIQKKLRSQETVLSPTDSNSRIGDFSGLVSKAKEGLNKSTSRTEVLKSPGTTGPPALAGTGSGTELSKKAENDFQWDLLVKTLTRPLHINDMDFTDLQLEDDADVFLASWSNGSDAPPPPPPFGMAPVRGGFPVMLNGGGPPPPPPMMAGMRGGPPPPPMPAPPPPATNGFHQRGPPPPPMPAPSAFGSRYGATPASSGGNANHHATQQQQQLSQKTIKKNKKTVKLFWKEVRSGDPIVMMKMKTFIWDELNPVVVDTQRLEHLFENRAKDLMTKEKQQEMNRNKEIIVLDPKRSNAINIGMTKLPPPRTIKTAILKMDSTIMNREGIEKILTTMMPTEEEKTRITEAQMGNPDVPLGSAEQFLMTLASISELPARLKLWAFKLDYDVMEREVAEPLMDLKQGLEELKKNKTFRSILATLLSIGNFLNGIEAKGFQIDYLAKVPEVKDTVHKHSLLHHLCHVVMEKFPDTSDLYSEIGNISRASKVDFDDLAINLQKMETECKASWDHLKAIAKHDGSTNMKTKMSEFLADCAERIIVLGIIHRRVINRFFKFLLYLGIPANNARDTKINQFLKVISEFALEYRTTRERVIQQLEKKANHRERNKTRGKMITDVREAPYYAVGKFKSKEVQADEELRQLLGSGVSDSEDSKKWGTVPGVRGRLKKPDVNHNSRNARCGSGFYGRTTSRDESSLTDGMTDGDDEIFESLVKTATAPSLRTTPRERKRARQVDRKS